MKGLENYLSVLVLAAIVAHEGNLLFANALSTYDKQLHSIIEASGDHLNPRAVDLKDAKLSVPELITKYGYPSEVHNITTEDGYIIQAHRIPYGKKCGESQGKKVVWLQHGLMGDSSNWVISGVDRGLAYVLADACFDVWMGNFRGNTYSKIHTNTTLNSTDPRFWEFSWNELGMYDLPANIDFALNHTKQPSLYYIGHSMGTTSMWVLLSEKPIYNSKILLVSALAPVAYMKNMRSYIRVLELYMDQIEELFIRLGIYELLPSSDFMDELGAQLCKHQSPSQAICSNILFLIGGFNSDQLDLELLPVTLGHSPAGSSVRCVLHYAQGISTGEFRKYDYGKEKNLEEYGEEIPPKYDLSKITAPVAFYWAENDFLADKIDVLKLSNDLPNIKRNYRIDHDNFTHLDFIWAIDQQELVNKPVLEFMLYGEFTTTPPNDSGVDGNAAGFTSLIVLAVTISFLRM